jgi:hypothetical protein
MAQAIPRGAQRNDAVKDSAIFSVAQYQQQC